MSVRQAQTARIVTVALAAVLFWTITLALGCKRDRVGQYPSDGVRYRSGSTICVEDYTDLVPGTYDTDHDAIQAACDAATSGVGDVVRFGNSCDGTCSSCSPATYTMKGGGESDLTCPHGVTYDGEGSTLAFADEGEIAWSLTRWWRVLVLSGDYSSTTTVVQDFIIDMNEDGFTPGVDESKQRGIMLEADAPPAGSLQAVSISGVDFKDSTWGCLTVYSWIDVSTSTTTSNNCHHGIQVSGAGSTTNKTTVDGHTGGSTSADDTTLKVEASSTATTHVEIKNSTLNATNSNNISYTSPGGGSLVVDNITATCPTSGSTRRCLLAYGYDAPITVQNSTFTGSDGYQTAVVARPGREVLIDTVTIAGGYFEIGPTYEDDGPATFTFDTVTWSGTGYSVVGDTWAIYGAGTITDFSSPSRTIELIDCDGGASNNLLTTGGGKVEIDQDTIDTYDAYGPPQSAEVIRCAATATYSCAVVWPDGAAIGQSTYLCGDGSGTDCEW